MFVILRLRFMFLCMVRFMWVFCRVRVLLVLFFIISVCGVVFMWVSFVFGDSFV